MASDQDHPKIWRWSFLKILGLDNALSPVRTTALRISKPPSKPCKQSRRKAREWASA
jgi:hypothetical protein